MHKRANKYEMRIVLYTYMKLEEKLPGEEAKKGGVVSNPK
jgi:hypothetical protein